MSHIGHRCNQIIHIQPIISYKGFAHRESWKYSPARRRFNQLHWSKISVNRGVDWGQSLRSLTTFTPYISHLCAYFIICLSGKSIQWVVIYIHSLCKSVKNNLIYYLSLNCIFKLAFQIDYGRYIFYYWVKHLLCRFSHKIFSATQAVSPGQIPLCSLLLPFSLNFI